MMFICNHQIANQAGLATFLYALAKHNKLTKRKDQNSLSMITSICTCHAEKVAAQMDDGQRVWTTLNSFSNFSV